MISVGNGFLRRFYYDYDWFCVSEFPGKFIQLILVFRFISCFYLGTIGGEIFVENPLKLSPFHKPAESKKTASGEPEKMHFC